MNLASFIRQSNLHFINYFYKTKLDFFIKKEISLRDNSINMEISVNTAQNVKIEYELAGIGPRCVAFLIDISIIGTITILLTLMISSFYTIFHSKFITFFYTILGLIPLYHLLCEIFLHGKSVGKIALNLQVIRIDGQKLNFWNYLLRWIFRLIDITLTGGAIAIISIAATKHMQRIGDLAAGTTVIKKKKAASLKQLSIYEPEEEYQITFPQVAILSDKDITIIKEAFQEIKKYRDNQLLEALILKIKEVTGITTDMHPLKFVETIIKDYIHLTQK